MEIYGKKAGNLDSLEVESFNISDITKYITVYNGDTNVTSNTSNWTLASISGPVTSTSITTLDTAGTYTLRYRFTYDGETKETGNITVTITGTKEEGSGETENPPTPEN